MSSKMAWKSTKSWGFGEIIGAESRPTSLRTSVWCSDSARMVVVRRATEGLHLLSFALLKYVYCEINHACCYSRNFCWLNGHFLSQTCHPQRARSVAKETLPESVRHRKGSGNVTNVLKSNMFFWVHGLSFPLQSRASVRNHWNNGARQGIEAKEEKQVRFPGLPKTRGRFSAVFTFNMLNPILALPFCFLDMCVLFLVQSGVGADCLDPTCNLQSHNIIAQTKVSSYWVNLLFRKPMSKWRTAIF